MSFPSLSIAFIAMFLAVIYSRTAIAQECQTRNLVGHEYEGGYIDVTFSENLRSLIDIDLEVYQYRSREEVIALVRQGIDRNVPRDQCGRHTSVGQTHDVMESPVWRTVTPLTTRMYLCLKTKGICCKGLKCRACTWIWSDENIGFRKTLDLTVLLRPFFRSADLQNGQVLNEFGVNAEPDLEELEDWEKALIEVLKTYLRVLESQYTMGLLHVSDLIKFQLPDLEFFEAYRRDFASVPNFAPHVYWAGFEMHEGRPRFRASLRDTRNCPAAEEISFYLSGAGFFAEQAVVRERVYSVVEGDTLSGIVRGEYLGKEDLLWAVASYNKISNPDKIVVGQELVLPSLARLSEAFEGVVQRGDSLWSRSGGNLELFREYVERFAGRGRNPNRVYPGDGI